MNNQRIWTLSFGQCWVNTEIETMSAFGKCLYAAKALTFVGCFGLFSYLSYGIFEQYARKTTIEDLHRTWADSYDLPTLVVCPEEPFKPDNLILTRSDYINQTHTVSVKFPVICSELSDMCDFISKKEFESYEILTLHNGRCRVLANLPKVSQIMWLILLAKKNHHL